MSILLSIFVIKHKVLIIPENFSERKNFTDFPSFIRVNYSKLGVNGIKVGLANSNQFSFLLEIEKVKI